MKYRRRSMPIRSLWALALFLGCSIPASADLVTQLLQDPIVGSPSEAYSTAIGINSSGWVVGNTTALDPEGFRFSFGNLWKPSGGATTPAIGLMEGFYDPWAFEEWNDIDIHDNGDVLMGNVTIDTVIQDTCADPPCINGGGLTVGHFGGGRILSKKDNLWIQSGITFEWLSSDSLWGPIDPQTTNSRGQRIENFGPNPCTFDDAISGNCGANLITPPVPEPASLNLLMIAMGALGIVVWRGKKQGQRQ